MRIKKKKKITSIIIIVKSIHSSFCPKSIKDNKLFTCGRGFVYYNVDFFVLFSLEVYR